METTDQPCRDVHGMEVSRDHKELLDMYSPVWEQEELARCDSWQQFLTRAAGALVELGLLPAGRTEPSQQSVILQALLVNRQRLNPQLVKELEQLVSSGIPRPLRGVAWQQLLGGPQAFPEGYYESLLFSMQGEAGLQPPAAARSLMCSSAPSHGPLQHLPVCSRPLLHAPEGDTSIACSRLQYRCGHALGSAALAMHLVIDSRRTEAPHTDSNRPCNSGSLTIPPHPFGYSF
jgi:hypothetical protein